MSGDFASCYYCGAPFDASNQTFPMGHSSDCPVYDGANLKINASVKLAVPIRLKTDGTLTFTSAVTPMGKPRMTRRDKWLGRPVVERYWAFKDAILHDAIVAGYNAELMDVTGIRVTARIPTPSSWSKSVRLDTDGKPHRNKPDADNILKGVCDALLKDDSCVYIKHVEKYWAYEPSLSISIDYLVVHDE